MKFMSAGSPLGEVLLASDGDRLRWLSFARGPNAIEPPAEWVEDTRTPVLRETAEQLDAYFAGKRKSFDLPLEPRGTAFERRVWRALVRIPYGKTFCYGEIARRLGKPKAFRAVGAANGKNPISVIIPCHRLIGKGGDLTGYGGGLERKRRLLELEGALATSS